MAKNQPSATKHFDQAAFTLDHIAYAVSSTDKAIEAFQILYPEVIAYKIFEPAQSVSITYLTNANAKYKIELVEGVGRPNPVENFITSGHTTPYHICFSAIDFEQAARRLKEKGMFMITRPFDTHAQPGMRACHFFHPDCGIIEIMGPINAQ